jgi:hypothetical protein
MGRKRTLGSDVVVSDKSLGSCGLSSVILWLDNDGKRLVSLSVSCMEDVIKVNALLTEASVQRVFASLLVASFMYIAVLVLIQVHVPGTGKLVPLLLNYLLYLRYVLGRVQRSPTRVVQRTTESYLVIYYGVFSNSIRRHH